MLNKQFASQTSKLKMLNVFDCIPLYVCQNENSTNWYTNLNVVT